jgi:hypothetical protein
MKSILKSLLKSLLLYGFFVIAEFMVMVKTSQLPLGQFLTRFGKDYGLLLVISHSLYMLAYIGVQGRINWLNQHPPVDFGKPEAEQRQKTVDYWLRWIVGPAFLLSLVCLIGLMFYATSNNLGYRFGVPLILFLLHLLLVSNGLNLLIQDYQHFLRKCLAKTVDEVLAEGKAPILYLRSFQDDAVSARRETSLITEEEELNKAFERIGPLIAIGKPGEVLPEVGAARAYFSNADWQAAVHHYMEISQLVLLRAGSSQGLIWEIQNSVQRLQPSKLILLIPFEKEAYDQFRARIQSNFPKPLPEHPGHSVHREFVNAEDQTEKYKYGSLLGLIHFDQDWTAHFEKISAEKLPEDYQMIGNPLVAEKVHLMLHYALRPVYARLGLEWDDLGLPWKA